MADAAPRPSPVLVYDRIDENRRLSRRLLVLFVLGTLPAALFVSAYAAVWLVMSTPLMLVIENAGEQAMVIFGIVAVVVGHLLLGVALWRFRTAPAAILRRVGARPVGEAEEDFRRSVASLCLGAGLPMPALHVCDTDVPNAFVVGHDPGDSALVVSRGLLASLERLELEGVIAHELSHIGNEDVRLNTTLAGVLRTFMLPLPVRVMLWLTVIPAGALLLAPGGEFGFDGGWRWLFAGQFAVTVWVLAWPTIGKLLQHALARRRELLADAQAVLLTRYPDGLARALLKLEQRHGGSGPFAAPQVAHLMILGPKPRFAPFATHPDVATRVAALTAMGASGSAALRARLEREAAQAPVGAPGATKAATARPPPIEPRPAAWLRVSAIALAASVAFLLLVVGIAVAFRLPTAQWIGYVRTAGMVGFLLAIWLGARAAPSRGTEGWVPRPLRGFIGAVLLLFVGAPVAMMLYMVGLDLQEQAVANLCDEGTGRLPGACALSVGTLVGALWIPVGAAAGVWHDAILRGWARRFAQGSFATRRARWPEDDETELPPRRADPPEVAQVHPARGHDEASRSRTAPPNAPPSGRSVCPGCGGASPPDARRCQWCGAEIHDGDRG